MAEAPGDQDQAESRDCGDACSLQQKHAAMLHRLAINEESRIQKFAALRAGSLACENPNESTDRFLQAFSESFKRLDQNLSSLQSRVSFEEAKSSVKGEVDLAALKVSELEQFVAENSYFLPAYEVRASQSSIASLREKLEGINAECLPKKRFSFKSKAGRDRKASDEGAVKPSKAAGSLDLESGKAAQDLTRTIQKGDQVSNGAGRVSSTASACAIRDLDGSVVVRDLKNQEDAEIILENLANCRIYIRGTCRAMYAHKLKSCKVYAGPVTGSVLIEDAEECVFMLASHQIRIHHAKTTDMYVRVRSRPIVEYTNDVRFAPYAFSYQGIRDDLLAASLSEETGLWENVDDFRWLRATPSPNWSVLPEEEREMAVDGYAMLQGGV